MQTPRHLSTAAYIRTKLLELQVKGAFLTILVDAEGNLNQKASRPRGDLQREDCVALGLAAAESGQLKSIKTVVASAAAWTRRAQWAKEERRRALATKTAWIAARLQQAQTGVMVAAQVQALVLVQVLVRPLLLVMVVRREPGAQVLGLPPTPASCRSSRWNDVLTDSHANQVDMYTIDGRELLRGRRDITGPPLSSCSAREWSQEERPKRRPRDRKKVPPGRLAPVLHPNHIRELLSVCGVPKAF
ncbi:hypothetical protein Efla_006687 [Eimeria flavescens]